MILTKEYLFEILQKAVDKQIYGGKISLTYDEEVYGLSLSEFVSDYRRWYPSDNSTIDVLKLMLTPQLQVVLMYRLAHYCFMNSRLSKEADIYALLGCKWGQMEIYYSVCIGKSLKVNHGVGSVIGARCYIGDNFLIHQNCTVGDKEGGRPHIGNNVIMYAGSMILGNVTIGDGCIIGANSVVMHSCPANSILVGNPAKIIGYRR